MKKRYYNFLFTSSVALAPRITSLIERAEYTLYKKQSRGGAEVSGDVELFVM